MVRRAVIVPQSTVLRSTLTPAFRMASTQDQRGVVLHTWSVAIQTTIGRPYSRPPHHFDPALEPDRQRSSESTIPSRSDRSRSRTSISAPQTCPSVRLPIDRQMSCRLVNEILDRPAKSPGYPVGGLVQFTRRMALKIPTGQIGRNTIPLVAEQIGGQIRLERNWMKSISPVFSAAT